MQSTADKKKTKYSVDTYALWYETMLRIRRFEEKALLMYSQQKIRGFLHVYIGQEAIAAGLKTAMRPEDSMVTAYRVHGLALMKGMTSKECMAELYGKSTGCVKGKGGSMHFFAKEHNFFGGNGIVGAQIPIGAGIAFAEKYRKTDNVCVTMFGDGAARQGALHETFNMSMNWKLPVLFICENNHYAMGTSVARTSVVTDMVKLGLSYEMPSESVDGMNPAAVHEAVTKAIEHIRAGNGPFYLEIKTYRYRGHSVSDPGLYRTKEELEHYKTLDPIGIMEHAIKEEGLIPETRMMEIQSMIEQEIEDAVQFAEESPWPEPSELYTDNYVESDYPFMID